MTSDHGRDTAGGAGAAAVVVVVVLPRVDDVMDRGARGFDKMLPDGAVSEQ